MASSRGSRFRRTSERHRSSWDLGPKTSGVGAPQVVAGSTAQLGGTISSAIVDSITLIRTRGELIMWCSAATAAGDGFHGAFGIAKATMAALVAGAASVPTPITEDTWDGWLYHRYFSLFSPGPVAVATAAQEQLQNAPNISSLRLEVDSKAMRKINVDESFYCALEVAVHGAGGMEWVFNSRILIKDMS